MHPVGLGPQLLWFSLLSPYDPVMVARELYCLLARRVDGIECTGMPLMAAMRLEFPWNGYFTGFCPLRSMRTEVRVKAFSSDVELTICLAA